MLKTKWSKKVDAKVRRLAASERLRFQLASGKKRNKDNEMVALSDKDIIRIEKELATLRDRV